MEDETENVLRNPFPSPPSHYTRYTSHNIKLLALLQERASSPGEESANQYELLSDQKDVPDWSLLQLEKPRVDWILEEPDPYYNVYGQTCEVNPNLKVYKWVKTEKIQHFSDDEEDEPLVPLPDDAEIIEGEEDMDQDETAAPSRAEPATEVATAEAEPAEDIPSKAPSPKAQLSMSLEQPPDLDDDLDASLKPLSASIDDGTGEGKVDGDLQLDISGLGPDGLPVESAHDLSQLTPSDALVGGVMMDQSGDPFAEPT
ncbi:hypothetical protein MD484_g1185, partial [Candolleomyces efflorescens]